jgi:CheY-like chemotaxis protein
MDCQMPEMDGFEATRRIRAAKQTSYHNIPIIAVTANAVKGDREKCLDAGMDDYISKPLNPKAMVSLLEHWLYQSLGEGRGLPGPPMREAAVVMDESEDVIDSDVLGCLLESEGDDGRMLAMDLIEHFLDTAPGQLRSLEEFARQGELEKCARTAHSFVSTSGNVGAMRFAQLLSHLEATCKRQSVDDLPEILPRVRDELGRAVSALQQLMDPAS